MQINTEKKLFRKTKSLYFLSILPQKIQGVTLFQRQIEIQKRQNGLHYNK